MVDTNQDILQEEEPVKKKKQAPKKSASKLKTEGKPNAGDNGAAKKLSVRKEEGAVKNQASSKPAAGNKGQAVAKMKKFFKGAWAELKKVHWPNRRQIVAFTGVVLVAVTIVAVLIFAVDSLFSKILEVIIPK